MEIKPSYTFKEAREVLGLGETAFEGLRKRGGIKVVGRKVVRAELERVAGFTIGGETAKTLPDEDLKVAEQKNRVAKKKLDIEEQLLDKGFVNWAGLDKRVAEVDKLQREAEKMMEQAEQREDETADKYRDMMLRGKGELAEIAGKIKKAIETHQGIEGKIAEELSVARSKAANLISTASEERERLLQRATRLEAQAELELRGAPQKAERAEKTAEQWEAATKRLSDWFSQHNGKRQDIVKLLMEIGEYLKKDYRYDGSFYLYIERYKKLLVGFDITPRPSLAKTSQDRLLKELGLKL